MAAPRCLGAPAGRCGARWRALLGTSLVACPDYMPGTPCMAIWSQFRCEYTDEPHISSYESVRSELYNYSGLLPALLLFCKHIATAAYPIVARPDRIFCLKVLSMLALLLQKYFWRTGDATTASLLYALGMSPGVQSLDANVLRPAIAGSYSWK